MRTPGQIGRSVFCRAGCRCPRELLRVFDKPFARFRRAVEHHVLDLFAQGGVEVVIHAEHAGVNDAHRQPGLNGVVEKYRVDGLTHRVVAAKAEADVGDAAGNLCLR